MIKIVKILLTQGKVAIIDAEDAPRVLRHRWYAHKERGRWYVATSIRSGGVATVLKLHRLILNPPAETDIDHIDCDGLNNRRSNLRLATRSQNNQNARLRANTTSGFKGVSWNKRKHKWDVRIRLNGCQKFLGYFQTKEEAAAAYDRAAIELFGEFARPNGHALNRALSELISYDTVTRLSRSKDRQLNLSL